MAPNTQLATPRDGACLDEMLAGMRNVVEDVSRIHQRTRRKLCFETIIERSLIDETVLLQPLACKACQSPNVKAVSLSMITEVEVYRPTRQVDRAAVAMFKVLCRLPVIQCQPKLEVCG